MQNAIVDLGALGATLLSAAIVLSGLVAAGSVFFVWPVPRRGVWRRTGDAGIRTLVALLLVAIFMAFFGPSLAALNEVSCRGVPDFEACMDGE